MKSTWSGSGTCAECALQKEGVKASKEAAAASREAAHETARLRGEVQNQRRQEELKNKKTQETEDLFIKTEGEHDAALVAAKRVMTSDGTSISKCVHAKRAIIAQRAAVQELLLNKQFVGLDAKRVLAKWEMDVNATINEWNSFLSASLASMQNTDAFDQGLIEYQANHTALEKGLSILCLSYEDALVQAIDRLDDCVIKKINECYAFKGGIQFSQKEDIEVFSAFAKNEKAWGKSWTGAYLLNGGKHIFHVWIFLILLSFFVVPGLLYVLWYNGERKKPVKMEIDGKTLPVEYLFAKIKNRNQFESIQRGLSFKESALVFARYFGDVTAIRDKGRISEFSPFGNHSSHLWLIQTAVPDQLDYFTLLREKINAIKESFDFSTRILSIAKTSELISELRISA